MLSDADLEGLMVDLESDRVERKRSPSDLKRICEAVCAFANDLADNRKPGVVLIGVTDDGACANLAISDGMIRDLAQMRSAGNILPLPDMSVQKRRLKGCDVAVVEVQPSPDPPVRYKGRVWIRVGSTRSIASAQEEKRLAEKRRGADLPFDRRSVPEASLADLDIGLFEREYLPNAADPKILLENQRSMEEQLRGLGFLGPDNRPNNAALLVFGKNPRAWLPGAYTQFLRLDGDALTDPIRDQKEIDGCLSEAIRHLEYVLVANIAVSTDLTSGPTEHRQPDYPFAALQQICRNALLHRTYEGTSAPVRVTWFNDRIEVYSPGGLYGVVSPQNIHTGATDYRNPRLAEAMKVMGFVQRFGLGLPLARRELEKNGNPPAEFAFESSGVLVTIRGRSS